MSDIETHDVIGSMKEGACWGNWSMSDNACSHCAIQKYCEDESKKIAASEATDKEEIIDEPSDAGVPDVAPIDFIIGTLGGKYEYTTRETDKSKGHYFKRAGESKEFIAIIVAKQGSRVKFMSKNGVKIVDKINSIEEAESLLKELPT